MPAALFYSGEPEVLRKRAFVDKVSAMLPLIDLEALWLLSISIISKAALVSSWSTTGDEISTCKISNDTLTICNGEPISLKAHCTGFINFKNFF